MTVRFDPLVDFYNSVISSDVETLFVSYKKSNTQTSSRFDLEKLF